MRIEPVRRNENPAAPTFQFAGFKVVDYTPTRAIVSVAVESTKPGKIVVLPLAVSWSDNDWKLVLQPNGGLIVSKPDLLRSLQGYVIFRGA